MLTIAETCLRPWNYECRLFGRGIWNTRWILKHSWHISLTTYDWLQTRAVGSITSRGGTAAVLTWLILICYLLYETYLVVIQRKSQGQTVQLIPSVEAYQVDLTTVFAETAESFPYEIMLAMLVGRRSLQALARKTALSKDSILLENRSMIQGLGNDFSKPKSDNRALFAIPSRHRSSNKESKKKTLIMHRDLPAREYGKRRFTIMLTVIIRPGDSSHEKTFFSVVVGWNWMVVGR